jgi:DNA-binding GntR family transcriptional regulator
MHDLDLSHLKPVNRPSTSEVVTSQIRDGILDGTFQPGTQMREVQLARQLKISRGPLREALHRLIQEGLLEHERHRGVFVVNLDEDDVEDIYFVREAIEIPAALRLAANPSVPVLTRLQDLVALMSGAASAHDWAKVVQLDAEFHQTVVRSAGSIRLERMFETVQAETRMCLGALKPSYPLEQDVVLEHQELVRCLLNRDPEIVRRQWTEHLQVAAANLHRLFTASTRTASTGSAT